jgi:hypothetical protein
MSRLRITATGKPADVLELVDFDAPSPGPGPNAGRGSGRQRFGLS